jgi:hypothetical protein
MVNWYSRRPIGLEALEAQEIGEDRIRKVLVIIEVIINIGKNPMWPEK